MSMLASQTGFEQRDSPFRSSAFLFRIALAAMTFEEVRPLGILLADYFLFASLFLLLCSRERRLLKSRGSGVLASCAVILCGTMLSGVATAAGVRFIILFGLFAPLAVAHAKDIQRNLRFLVGGVTINCLIAILGVWIYPGIVAALAINPKVPGISEELGRAAGLTGHPNDLGASAALAVLIAVGLLLHEDARLHRWMLSVAILFCTLGAILSGSRTFFVAVIPPLVVLMLWRPWDRKLIARASIGLLGFFVVWAGINYLVSLGTTSYAERLTQTNTDEYENSGRLLMAAVALEEIAQKPIAGWGLDHFGEAGMVYIPAQGDFLPAHANFLHFWYAEGILGAIGFAMLFLLPVKQMLHALKKGCPTSLAEALRLGICVYLLLLIASNLHPILFQRYLYLPLFMFGGLAAGIPGQSVVRFSKKSSRKQVLSRALLRPAMPSGETNSTGGA
jgi:O-Antigen ligase